MFLAKMILHIFHTRTSKFRRVLIKFCTKEILCAHSFKKFEGTLIVSGGIPQGASFTATALGEVRNAFSTLHFNKIGTVNSPCFRVEELEYS